MASPALNLAAFSGAELSALLTAAKAELLVRITGQVQSGSSAGQSYSMALMSTAELTSLINYLTDALGLDSGMSVARPNFSCSGITSDPATSE
jgi:hypothetical protein